MNVAPLEGYYLEGLTPEHGQNEQKCGTFRLHMVLFYYMWYFKYHNYRDNLLKLMCSDFNMESDRMSQ